MTSRHAGAALGLALPCSPENALVSLDGGTNQPPEGGTHMGEPKPQTKRREREAAAGTAAKLRTLEQMTVGELAEKYREVFGEPTRTRNKEYLKKRIAWRIQELAEGGLTPRALELIERLAPEAPARWRQPVVRNGGPAAPAVVTMKAPRDPRLPAEAVEPGALACRPCDQRHCVPGDFRCLTGISPAQVIDAAERLLAGDAVG